MKSLRIALLCAVPLLMGNQGGCALFSSPQQRSAVDTFCLTAKKRLWSIEDSPESVREAVIWNKTVDRRCGIPGRD